MATVNASGTAVLCEEVWVPNSAFEDDSYSYRTGMPSIALVTRGDPHRLQSDIDQVIEEKRRVGRSALRGSLLAGGIIAAGAATAAFALLPPAGVDEGLVAVKISASLGEVLTPRGRAAILDAAELGGIHWGYISDRESAVGIVVRQLCIEHDLESLITRRDIWAAHREQALAQRRADAAESAARILREER